ncbi:MAG: penicillin-binding protein 2 [Oscillospiraceae bacterium]|jgi:penicillin-binding protein 2|nr:penicillin-binding protein 2 [Oscillospiraceae bacterium]
MLKRLVWVYAIFIVGMQFILMQVFSVINNKDYVAVVERQGSYTLTVAKTRGRIYDAKMRPIAGGYPQTRVAIAPSSIDLAAFKAAVPEDTFEGMKEFLNKSYPFAFTLPMEKLEAEGVTVFNTETRYGASFPAVHTVGYLDSTGQNGLTGIEKAYNDVLSNASGSLKITYQVDARGGVLAGFAPEINDTTALSKAGVVLTIDKDIQAIAEEAAGAYLGTGSVVVMEIPSGDIRAMVSVPGFSPLSLESVLDNEDSPLINRSMSAFDLGSVFKLVTAAAALECGIPSDTRFTCNGSLQIGTNVFTCNGGAAHGELDMEGAVTHSCNLYFIQLAQQIGGERLLKTAKVMGFGKSLVLAPNYESSAGKLPSESTLIQPAALANFSFGQGELLATPLHDAALVGTIASKGIYITPRLVDRIVDAEGKTVEVMRSPAAHMAINESTARELAQFMNTTVLEGTAKPGKPEECSSAAKTGTAETGMKKDGKKVLQAWYAGFFPYEKPKYVCVVLAENGKSGGRSGGPVFKQIADEITLFEAAQKQAEEAVEPVTPTDAYIVE